MTLVNQSISPRVSVLLFRQLGTAALALTKRCFERLHDTRALQAHAFSPPDEFPFAPEWH